MNDWFPIGCRTGVPEIGDLIAHKFMALRLLAIDDAPDGDDRTVRLHVRREYGPTPDAENDRGEFGLRVRKGFVRWLAQIYQEENIPLCSCHHHPYPCTEIVARREALRDMSVTADRISRANEGHCFSCGELITPRQARIIAPEPNVMLDGFPPPMFHLRHACRPFLQTYDRARRQHLAGDWAPLIVDQPTLKEADL